jgi:host factor-I protein
MTKNQINVQDQFLNRIRRDRIPVTIDLINGQRKEGVLFSFDNFSLILRGDNDQLIYKHAISSISVDQKLNLTETK